jgi:hypothetical protein
MGIPWPASRRQSRLFVIGDQSGLIVIDDVAHRPAI